MLHSRHHHHHQLCGRLIVNLCTEGKKRNQRKRFLLCSMALAWHWRGMAWPTYIRLLPPFLPTYIHIRQPTRLPATQVRVLPSAGMWPCGDSTGMNSGHLPATARLDRFAYYVGSLSNPLAPLPNCPVPSACSMLYRVLLCPYML
jgi:hypothetical protein